MNTPLLNKRFAPWIIGAIILVVIVVGIFLFRQTRGRAALPAQALENFMAAQTYHVKANISINVSALLQDRERPFTNVIGVVEGDVRREEHGTPEFTGQLYGQMKGRGEEFSTDGELRVLNDAVAFRLKNFPVLVNPSGSLRNRWTYVDAPLLQTRNAADIVTVLQNAFAELNYLGRVQSEGAEVVRYSGTLTPETKANLVSLFHQDASGNEGWHVLARLLGGNDVRSVTVDITPQGEFHEITAVFTRQRPDGQEFERAGVKLSFSEYNKAVNIERPPRQSRVSPSVFAKLFGAGEIEPQ